MGSSSSPDHRIFAAVALGVPELRVRKLCFRGKKREGVFYCCEIHDKYLMLDSHSIDVTSKCRPTAPHRKQSTERSETLVHYDSTYCKEQPLFLLGNHANVH